MYWYLIAAGVTAGLGLVLGKQWFDRHDAGDGRNVTGRRTAAEPASAPGSEPIRQAPPQGPQGPGRTDSAATIAADTAASPQAASTGRRVDDALASGDLSAMETELRETSDPIDRNRLLSRLVAELYRLRAEPDRREAFYRVAQAQVDEAPAILNAIEAAGRPRPEHIDAFKFIAIAREEERRYDAALAVCETALSLGLEDGTKTGFNGRIARLKRRRDAD